MVHVLPELPWAKDALAPIISAETIEYHYGKHHQAYVTNLNKLIEHTTMEEEPLEKIILTAPMGGIYNNAAQVWNHSFYWKCMKPNGGGEPAGALADLLIKGFGSVQAFREKFTAAAVGTFGSGWAWLVRNRDGTLTVESTGNAMNPLRDGKQPLLTCDVWEHAYYIDYRNARAKYVEAWWNLVDWAFAASNLG
ncbi:MAG TPA: superoxide dismutase [Clostridia bacterium]|nr:superoxide dismutase [Clostridia bacterium]